MVFDKISSLEGKSTAECTAGERVFGALDEPPDIRPYQLTLRIINMNKIYNFRFNVHDKGEKYDTGVSLQEVKTLKSNDSRLLLQAFLLRSDLRLFCGGVT